MTKLRVHVQVFFSLWITMVLKKNKNNEINNLFIILVLSFYLEKKIDWWKRANDNGLFSNLQEPISWELVELKYSYFNSMCKFFFKKWDLEPFVIYFVKTRFDRYQKIRYPLNISIDLFWNIKILVSNLSQIDNYFYHQSTLQPRFRCPVTTKERGDDFEMEIPNILNTNSTKFAGNFQRAERRLQRVLFLNLNLSNQQILLF
jgi:hypothetical protein